MNSLKRRLTLSALFVLSSIALVFSQDKYQVVFLHQNTGGIIAEATINIAGGSMEFLKSNAKKTPFDNVFDVLKYMDEYGYSVDIITPLIAEVHATNPNHIEQMKLFQIVQYVFKLRNDKKYPELKLL